MINNDVKFNVLRLLKGNSVLWKPSDTAILSNWAIYEIMREAGVPEGVVVSFEIQFYLKLFCHFRV